MRCFVHIVSEGGRWREGGREGGLGGREKEWLHNTCRLERGEMEERRECLRVLKPFLAVIKML